MKNEKLHTTNTCLMPNCAGMICFGDYALDNFLKFE